MTPHTASRWLSKGNKALLADVPGKKHLSDAPTRLVGACLRALGLKARRTTLGSVTDGSRADGYVLDMDKAEAWAKANSRAWRRHLGQGVVDLGICALIVDHRQGRDIWEDEDEINVEVLLGDGGFVRDEQQTMQGQDHQGSRCEPGGRGWTGAVPSTIYRDPVAAAP